MIMQPVASKIAELAGVPSTSSSVEAVNHVRISGRMEVFRGTHENDSNVIAVVDYAHNGISVTTLFRLRRFSLCSRTSILLSLQEAPAIKQLTDA